MKMKNKGIQNTISDKSKNDPIQISNQMIAKPLQMIKSTLHLEKQNTSTLEISNKIIFIPIKEKRK
jgi:uncharacterized protein YxjI